LGVGLPVFQPGEPHVSCIHIDATDCCTGPCRSHWLSGPGHTGKRLPLQVRHSAAGHYIGTADEDGPVSRESVEYFRSQYAAEHALATGRWQQRLHP